jgi:hypothetical protein
MLHLPKNLRKRAYGLTWQTNMDMCHACKCAPTSSSIQQRVLSHGEPLPGLRRQPAYPSCSSPRTSEHRPCRRCSVLASAYAAPSREYGGCWCLSPLWTTSNSTTPAFCCSSGKHPVLQPTQIANGSSGVALVLFMARAPLRFLHPVDGRI